MSAALDLTSVLAVGIPASLYAAGSFKLWGRGGRIPLWQLLCGAAGFLVLALTLLSPLHEIGERLFSAHMIEHEILMAVAAPIIVLARPALPILWGIPRFARRAIGITSRRIADSLLFRAIARPSSATILHGAAIWLWHAPALFGAGLASEGMHWLQHASFFFTALLFWWSMLVQSPDEHNQGTAIGHLFATAMHTGLLGALLTFSTRLWYPPALGAVDWGLNAIEDQQLAGLVMWIPGAASYALAALWIAGRWIASAPHPMRRDYALGD